LVKTPCDQLDLVTFGEFRWRRMNTTGKTIKVTATGIFRVVDGKATDNWVNFDALGLLQQMGAAPAPRK
jgi:hypothetical protein